jgi:mRNA interferase RelE/StbE
MLNVPFTYELLLTNQARKELGKIKKGNPAVAALIAARLESLKFNPNEGAFLHGDLKGRKKVRVGDYRIVYRVEKNKLVVLIFRIAHRKEAYR